MNSIFENRNSMGDHSHLEKFRCEECGYVGSHKIYPLCSKR